MRERERGDREIEIFHLLLYSPNDHTEQWLGQGQDEAKSLELHLVSHVVAGTQVLGPLPVAFLGALAEG